MASASAGLTRLPALVSSRAARKKNADAETTPKY